MPRVSGCLAEDVLLDLAQGAEPLGEAPAIEEHLASCPSCCALLSTILATTSGERARTTGSLAGRSLGPYRLEALIGAGASGEVYRGWDERLDRRVAIKVLSDRAEESGDRARRWEIEARAAAAIAHPNVVTVYDVGRADGRSFLVSELLDGESLRSVIDRGPVPRDRAFALGLDLIHGLVAAHDRGVIHRDLKPHNLIVTRAGALKILDFGLAKRTVPDPVADLDATQPGTVLGTVGYLSPEQARGEPADARSDIFSTGAILYELFTGERAFGGATFAERLSAVLRDTPAGLTAERLGDMSPIIARCLEKEPSRRFQSARDLAWILERSAPVDRAAPADREAPAARVITSRRTIVIAAAAALSGLAIGRAIAPSAAPEGARASGYHQLTFRQGLIGRARFTHDGSSVIYGAAWDDQPLSIYTTRLGGGGTRQLELPSADVLAVSSRGEIAISIGRRYVEGFHQVGRLALAPIEGGEPRVAGDDVQDADFSPDGASLAVLRRDGAVFRIEYPLGTRLFEHPGWISHPRVSPDGARVACLLHDSPHDDRGRVAIIERATGTSRIAGGAWSSVVGLAFSADGRTLFLSASKEGGNNAIRAVSLDGRESLVAETPGRLRLHDRSRSGVALISHDAWRLRMMVKPPRAAAEIDLSLSDVAIVTAITPDGRTLALAEIGDVNPDSGGAYLRPSAGGRAMRLGAGIPRAITDDGRRVLAELPEGPARFVIYEIGVGEARAVPLDPIVEATSVRFRGADQLVVAGAAQGKPSRLWLVPIGSPPSPVTAEGVSGKAQVSNDGKRAAFITQEGQCWILDLGAGAPPRPVPGSFRGEVVSGFYEGDREILVRTKEIPIVVRRVDVDSGASTPHLTITPPVVGRKGVESVVMDARGEVYAYSYGQELSRLYATSAERG